MGLRYLERSGAQLWFKKQVAVVVRGTFVQLQVHQLYPYLDCEALVMITHVLLISLFNYCNEIYMRLPLSSIQKLQLVQNVAVLTILRSHRIAHITVLLHDLHLLPVCFYIQFKFVTFKALYDMDLWYLRRCLSPMGQVYPT